METVTENQTNFRTYLDEDTNNNRLLIKFDNIKAIVYLKLSSETRKRKLGMITYSTKTFKTKRKRALHLLRKGNAYGFNEYFLREAKLFDKVWLVDDFSDWKIPISFILDPKNGFYLDFKKQGFELQKFLSLGEIEQFRVLPKENRRI